MKYSLLLSLITLAVPAFAEIEGEVHEQYPRVSLAKIVVFTNLFNEADTNGDHALTEEEFGNSYGASERPVVTKYRFNELSSANSTARAITIEQPVIWGYYFIVSNGGRKIYPSKAEMFDLADDNNDNLLTPLEFFYTRIRSASNSRSSFKAFIKLDKNDDGSLSPAEFGVELKH